MTLGAGIAITLALLVAVAFFVAARDGTRRAQLLDRRLAKATRDLEHLQLAFARFTPAAVVEEIATHGVATEAAKREVTVLFADLKGFTQMSDQLDPTVLVGILNGYFRAMSAAITGHRGHVSKFIGDGLMALFGALERNPWQARDAVEAALAMRAALEVYNARLRADGLPELAFGIGIHRGHAVAGVIGSDELMEFTVIGDTVNVASRIESLTRTHGVDLLVTESVQEALDPKRFRLRAMPAVTVKGKPEPIVTYAVDGVEDAPRSTSSAG